MEEAGNSNKHTNLLVMLVWYHCVKALIALDTEHVTSSATYSIEWPATMTNENYDLSYSCVGIVMHGYSCIENIGIYINLK